MSEFKKTLQDGTPGPLSQAGAEVSTPLAMAAAPRRRPKTTAPPLSHLYEPPSPTHEESERARPAPPTRIVETSAPAPSSGATLPADAPGWMIRARSMSLALEAAIAAGQVTEPQQASIERAWAAWELDGIADKNVARVATLVDRARSAIRDAPVDQLERAYNDCAQVLWASLPREIKAKQDLPDVVLVMRSLRDEADPWAAIIDGTARILGWSDAARAHTAHAIRVAIASERSS